MGFSRQEHWNGLPSPSPCKCLAPLNKRSQNDEEEPSVFIYLSAPIIEGLELSGKSTVPGSDPYSTAYFLVDAMVLPKSSLWG